MRMNRKIHKQQEMDLHSCSYCSVCLNESTDVTGSAAIGITLQFEKDNEAGEELFKFDYFKHNKKCAR
jgi:hypothetical protein